MENLFLKDYFKKKKIIFIRGLFFFILIMITFIAIKKVTLKNNDFIAKINVEEIIFDNKDLIEKIEKIENDSALKGIVVSINSPGGTVVASQELYKKLKKISEKKPIVVSMKEVAASGGYMVALSANKIFCYEGTLTGSIGVIMQTANIESLLKKIGVQPIIFKSGKLKAVPNPVESLESEGKESIKKIIDNMHQEFLKLVTQNRKIKSEHIDMISDGRIFTGLQAQRLNLIDEIGSEKDAIDWLKKSLNIQEKIKIIEINRDNKLLNSLNFSKLKNIFSTNNMVFINGLFALWYPSYE